MGKLVSIKKDFRWLITGVFALMVFNLVLLLYLKTRYLKSLDILLQQLILSSKSDIRSQFYYVVFFFSDFGVTFALTIITAISVWQISKQTKPALWIVFSILSGKVLVLLANYFFQQLFFKKTFKLDLINEHILLSTVFFLIILVVILPELQDQETQFLTILADVIWLSVVIVAQLYIRSSSITEVLLSLTLAIVWWEALRIIYLLV